jgi:hypothetical protein
MIDPAEKLVSVCNAIEDAANDIIGRLCVEISPAWQGVSIHVVDTGENYPATNITTAINKIYQLFPDLDWSSDPLTGAAVATMGV